MKLSGESGVLGRRKQEPGRRGRGRVAAKRCRPGTQRASCSRRPSRARSRSNMSGARRALGRGRRSSSDIRGLPAETAASANSTFALLALELGMVSTLPSENSRLLPWGRISQSARNTVWKKTLSRAPGLGGLIPWTVLRSLSHGGKPVALRRGPADRHRARSQRQRLQEQAGRATRSLQPQECRAASGIITQPAKS